MNIINVTTREQLKELYIQNALTWEGMNADEENLSAITKWLDGYKAIRENIEPTFCIITGEFMNISYGLTGINAYPNDINIVSVININQGPIIIPRFEVGGRWFDNIVDNNARRERE